MVIVSLGATDDELLQIVRSWLDVMAMGDYGRVFEELGYAMAYGAGSEAIRRDIKSYRSPDFYPGVADFSVSDWRTPVGGNPEPRMLIRRYKYNASLPIVATVELDLPLNGRWSDLEAHFVLTVSSEQDTKGILSLEDIRGPARETADA